MKVGKGHARAHKLHAVVSSMKTMKAWLSKQRPLLQGDAEKDPADACALGAEPRKVGALPQVPPKYPLSETSALGQLGVLDFIGTSLHEVCVALILF